MSEKIYSQEEWDVWRESYIKDYPKHLDTAPATKESLKELSDAINCLAKEKMDRSLFWKLFIMGVPMLIAVIGHLYVIYYGGIADLGKGVAVIQTEITNIKDDIQEIKIDFKEATKPD